MLSKLFDNTVNTVLINTINQQQMNVYYYFTYDIETRNVKEKWIVIIL